MKRVLLKSVFDAFEYVMAHYYPFGMEEMAERTDTYAVVSIQDSHTGGFGFTFERTRYCKDVLTLSFDDIDRPVEGAVLFSEVQARRIIAFIRKNRGVDSLLVHCYAGQSRSRAVAAFAVGMLGADNAQYFAGGSPNMHVYDTLCRVYRERSWTIPGSCDTI